MDKVSGYFKIEPEIKNLDVVKVTGINDIKDGFYVLVLLETNK